MLSVADDVKLFKSIFESISSSQLAADLLSLEDWCNAWKLKLNGHKCAHLSFTFSHKPSMFTDTTRYSVGGFTIASVANQKDLGIIITNTLSGNCHYRKICKKAYHALHLLRRTLPPSAPVMIKKQLYISLVRSHFSYCSQIWKPHHVKDILILERVQRRAYT